jgi:hypothetical protein
LFLADRQTDMTKLIVAFRNFVNVPKYALRLEGIWEQRAAEGSRSQERKYNPDY